MHPPAHSPEEQRAIAAARWMVLLAAILWSTSGLFAKATIFHDWSGAGLVPHRGLLLVFWRALSAMVILLPFIRRPRWTWKLLPVAVLFAVMNVTYLSAMVHTTAANAIWIQNTAPLWVFLIGTTVLRDPIHPRDWLQQALVLCGVGFILCFELPGSAPAGALWALASGAAYAGVVLSLRWLRGEDSAWIVAFNFAATLLLLSPYVALHGETPTPLQLATTVAFGSLQMGLPYLLFARSVRRLPAHEATGIVLLEPVLVPIWVWLAWGESPRWWTLVGAGLILLGMIARYLPRAVRWGQNS